MDIIRVRWQIAKHLVAQYLWGSGIHDDDHDDSINCYTAAEDVRLPYTFIRRVGERADHSNLRIRVGKRADYSNLRIVLLTEVTLIKWTPTPIEQGEQWTPTLIDQGDHSTHHSIHS